LHWVFGSTITDEFLNNILSICIERHDITDNKNKNNDKKDKDTFQIGRGLLQLLIIVTWPVTVSDHVRVRFQRLYHDLHLDH